MAVLSALSLAAAGAFAAEALADSAPLTRAQVVQSVIAARAASELRPAGDAADFQSAPVLTASTVTREQVQREIIAARDAGQLEPAGEAELARGWTPTPATTPTLTRAAVKAETRRASAAGELLPAGEISQDPNVRQAAHVTSRNVN
ncbi:MAG: hypothetical protein ABI887_00800 [Burkholderiales bacterium]